MIERADSGGESPTRTHDLAGRARLGGMSALTLRCPRCKRTFSSDDADQLADALVSHVEQDHGHAPPREHVLARIERQNSAD